MLRVISSVEAVEQLKAAGFNTNVNRLNAGLRQGVYPLGVPLSLTSMCMRYTQLCLTSG